MEIRHASPIGAEILGVDVKHLDEATLDNIYQAWLDCNVIAVRGQALRIDDYLAYSRHFGAVLPHPTKSTRHPDYPEITMLGTNKFRADGTLDREIYLRGEGFHTDGSYEAILYKTTQLCAIDMQLSVLHVIARNTVTKQSRGARSETKLRER
ncbi:MAG: TauD/TfdA family dioxygenase [Pseudomonadota bacterium]